MWSICIPRWSADAFFIARKEAMGIFEIVKEQITPRMVMERSGLKFNRSNMCHCPFHQDGTASMKAKPTDRKYFCFGCGEKGDAIDFIAKYYHLSALDAAKQIASEFGISTDEAMHSPPKERKREKSIAEILDTAKSRAYIVLSDYLHVLKEWKREFAPRSPAEDIDPRYVEAIHQIPKLEYWLDILLWESEEDKELLLCDTGKDVDCIDERITEYRRSERNARIDRARKSDADIREL